VKTRRTQKIRGRFNRTRPAPGRPRRSADLRSAKSINSSAALAGVRSSVFGPEAGENLLVVRSQLAGAWRPTTFGEFENKRVLQLELDALFYELEEQQRRKRRKSIVAVSLATIQSRSLFIRC